MVTYVLCLTSCNSQEKSSDIPVLTKQNVAISLKYGYGIPRKRNMKYSISVINDSLIVKNHIDEEEYFLQLTNIQLDSINGLASAIKKSYLYRNDILDGWMIKLIIHGDFFQARGFSVNSPLGDVKNLIDYTADLSSVNFDFKEFFFIEVKFKELII